MRRTAFPTLRVPGASSPVLNSLRGHPPQPTGRRVGERVGETGVGGCVHSHVFASLPRKGPEEAGSGHYGPRYITGSGVGEDDDDDGFEDDLDLDIFFEEVTDVSALKAQGLWFSC